MAPEKKNEFLDAADSDDDQSNGYDSEADEIQKGRSAKRRRVDDEDDVEADDVSDNDEGASDEEGAAAEDDVEDAPTDGSKPPASTKTKAKASDLPDITKTLTRKNLIATEAAIRRSGVVYLSRIPPYMKPHKLRSLLTPHGTINRIFLAPEDPAAHTRRVKSGGNKKRLYTEGWVEFTSKKDARRTCEMLNARTIGGKKGSYYRDDIWNLLYLKGFKWNNLTEQIASENAERASRMRAEISKTTRENKEFVRNVERSKVLEGVKATQEKKRKREDKTEGAAAAAEKPTAEGADGGKGRMSFKQVALAPRGGDKTDQPEHVTRVLSKIF